MLRAQVELCERVEQARGDDAVDTVQRARSEWEGFGATVLPNADEATLRARFEAACQRAVERHEKREEIQKMRVRLGELAERAEQLAADEQTPQTDWDAVTREWQELRAQVEDPSTGPVALDGARDRSLGAGRRDRPGDRATLPRCGSEGQAAC